MRAQVLLQLASGLYAAAKYEIAAGGLIKAGAPQRVMAKLNGDIEAVVKAYDAAAVAEAADKLAAWQKGRAEQGKAREKEAARLAAAAAEKRVALRRELALQKKAGADVSDRLAALEAAEADDKARAAAADAAWAAVPAPTYVGAALTALNTLVGVLLQLTRSETGLLGTLRAGASADMAYPGLNGLWLHLSKSEVSHLLATPPANPLPVMLPHRPAPGGTR
jgi:hypothetical protein